MIVMDRQGHLDQGAEEEEGGLVEGGVHVNEVQQPDLHSVEDHGVGDQNKKAYIAEENNEAGSRMGQAILLEVTSIRPNGTRWWGGDRVRDGLLEGGVNEIQPEVEKNSQV